MDHKSLVSHWGEYKCGAEEISRELKLVPIIIRRVNDNIILAEIS